MTKPSWQDYGTYDESEHARLWDGVVGAWCPSLGPTGSRLHDHSRSVNWGTLTNMDNATDWVVDGGQYALDFDGANDNVTIASSVQIPGSALTVCGWVKTNNISLNQVLVNQGTTTNQFILFYQSNGWKMRGASATEVSFGSLTANTWTHVAGVFNGTSAIGYLQGMFSGSGTITAAAANLSTNLEIGRYSPFGSGYYWNGQIGEVAIYNRALAANEIRDLYLLGRGGMFERRRRSRRRAIEQAVSGVRRRRILTGMV